jgi:hypothetical protein
MRGKWVPFYQASATHVLRVPDSKKAARHEAGGFLYSMQASPHAGSEKN